MKRKAISLFIVTTLLLGLWSFAAVPIAWAATCTSTKSGNWNDSTVWSCGSIPGSGDDVTILLTHQITLTQNESVNNITINNPGSNISLVSGAFTLDVYGTLNSDTTTPRADIINSSTTIHFVGSANRALFGASWGAATTGLVFEVALVSGTIGTASTNVKARSITITSGTFNITGELKPDNGAANSGSLTISSGATLVTNGKLSRTTTTNTPFASFTNNGTFKTSSGTNPLWPDSTTCSFSANSTVEYSGANQTIQTPSGSSYGNLILSGTGTKTAPASLKVRGNFTNNGVTFGAGSGTVTLHGTALQTIGGSSATAFNNLTVNSGANVILPTNATATLLTNNGTITQTQTVIGSSDVTFIGIGGYGGVILNASGSDLGSTDVVIKNNQACNVGDQLVHRCFNITPTTKTGRNATITFYFTDAELNGNACATMEVYHWNGAAWDTTPLTRDTTYGSPSLDGRDCTNTPRSIRVTGVATFSPFGLTSGGTPTAITLSRFDANSESGNLSIVILLIALSAIMLSGVLIARRRRI
jgi:hypothetical protein